VTRAYRGLHHIEVAVAALGKEPRQNRPGRAAIRQ
jgi:hypothetical protein